MAAPRRRLPGVLLLLLTLVAAQEENATDFAETYGFVEVDVPACEGPSECPSGQCIFLDFFIPVFSCPSHGRCVCAPELTAVSCEGPTNCRQPAELCYYLGTLEEVEVCPEPDTCVCAPAPPVDGLGCNSADECSFPGDHCVQISTAESVVACPDGRCVCVDPMVDFPCTFPDWKYLGCRTFETIDSVCNGGLLSNVSEVCGGNKCKVLVPDFAGGGSCKGYCGAQGLGCKAAWNVTEPSCDWYPEETSCATPFVEDEHRVCECSGNSIQRRSRHVLDNEMVDRCGHLLTEYEECIAGHPHLWEYYPKESIRKNIEREQRAKCVHVPKDAVEKLGVVGCSR